MKVLKFISYLLILLVVGFYIWNPIIENIHQYIPDDVPKHLVPENLNAIDTTFGLCVYIIFKVGDFLNLSYNETNIWLFVVVMPSIIVVQFLYIQLLRKRLRVVQ